MGFSRIPFEFIYFYFLHIKRCVTVLRVFIQKIAELLYKQVLRPQIRDQVGNLKPMEIIPEG